MPWHSASKENETMRRRQKGAVRVIWEETNGFIPTVHVRETNCRATCEQQPESRAPYDTLASTFRSSDTRQDAFTFTICHITAACSSAKKIGKTV
jgi:hypothetical protein